MSKIGRKPIITDDVQVEVKGQEVHYKGSCDTGVYLLPNELGAYLEDNKLFITAKKEEQMARKRVRNINRIWGLHRALLAGKIRGAAQEFTKEIQIVGLGYKAIISGKKLVFSLGYSHKIDFDLPQGVSVDIDRSGQKLTVKSTNKFLVGQVCSEIKSLRRPEPYKGTGIKLSTEEIRRKAGKAKASAA